MEHQEMKKKIQELEKKVQKLENDNFYQKLINSFTNVLMIFIGVTFGIIFKKIGL